MLLAVVACASRAPGAIQTPAGEGWTTHSQGSVRTSTVGSGVNYYAFGYLPLTFAVVQIPRTVAVYPGEGSPEASREAPTCTGHRTIGSCMPADAP